MLIAAERKSPMVSCSAAASSPLRRCRRAHPADAAMQETYLGGFCSFHGSLTFGIGSTSTLAGLPSAVLQFPSGFIASSPVNLPLVALIRSKTAAMPSQPSTERKSGVALPAYSLFQAARKALLAGRSAATE